MHTENKMRRIKNKAVITVQYSFSTLLIQEQNPLNLLHISEHIYNPRDLYPVIKHQAS